MFKTNLFRKYAILILGLIIAFHTFILTKLIFFPYQELFTYPYLTNNGIFPYTQNLDQHFPGLLLSPINLATLGFDTPAEMRILSILIVAVVHLLLFTITRKISKSIQIAILSNLVFLIWQPFFEGWVLWIDSFLPLFLLPVFYFSFKAWQKPVAKYLFLTGLFFGIGLIFKQVILPIALVVGLLIFLKHKNFKTILYIAIGFLPLPILMIYYFFSRGALADFWYWTVQYNLTVFSHLGKKPATITQLVRIISVFGFTIFSVLSKYKKESRWILLFLVLSLSSAISRADFVHFQPALPFVAIASAVAISALWQAQLKIFVYVYALGALMFLSVFYKGHIGNRVLFFDSQTYAIAEKIKDYTAPGDHIFIYGSSPHIYQLSQTLPAGNIYIQQFSWFMVVAEDRILAAITQDEPYLIVADKSVDDGLLPITQYSPKLLHFIEDNYILVDNIDNTQFLLNKDRYPDSKYENSN